MSLRAPSASSSEWRRSEVALAAYGSRTLPRRISEPRDTVGCMRARVVVLLVLIAGSLAWVGTRALSGNLVYYVTPTELLQQHPPAGEHLRLGGLVVPGSVHQNGDGVNFIVTDGTTRMTVVHGGGTPALFRTGIGVVLEGTFGADGAFHSDTMLIKHGEEYRPPASGETPSPALIG